MRYRILGVSGLRVSTLFLGAMTFSEQLGATTAQVALAWTMAHSRVVHPILGVRRLDQLCDTLAAAELTLPPEAVARLDEATAFDLGFPHDFIRGMQTFVFGTANALVDP